MNARAATFVTFVLLTGVAVACAFGQDYARARATMLERHLEARGIEDEAVLRAMGTVPRERFVPAVLRAQAYADHPLPIGGGQTISQPYIVALMTELARLEPDDVVLEIGTGSGYQAAVLGEIVERVYTIEIRPELAASASELLQELGYENVTAKQGDGYLGWEEHAPFDAILVTAAPDHVPPALVEQLAPTGRLIIPVGPQSEVQKLQRITKTEDGSTTTEEVLPVVFVPLVRQR